MSDHAALLAAICEHPGEDTPRLAFADYLDEHAATAADREWAQFIRDDVGATARPECDPARLRWERVEKPRREAEPWVRASLPPELRTPPGSDGPLRRGFPWSLRLTPTQFLAAAERFLPQVPAGVLVFAGPDRAWGALAKSPHLARLSGLHVRQAALGPDAVRQLAESPHALAIEWLSAGHDGLTHAALPTLLRSPLFARLTRLDLDGRPWVGGVFAQCLAQIGGRVRLRELSLAEAGVSGAHLQLLLTSIPAENLERLGLKGNRIGLAGHEALARLPLDNLRRLDLSETAPGADGFHALMTSLTLSRLERLGYRKNHVNGALRPNWHLPRGAQPAGARPGGERGGQRGGGRGGRVAALRRGCCT
jgi:uncharacterized protein (TIGR02996 family)